MRYPTKPLKMLASAAATGQLSALFTRVARRVNSTERFICMRRDLDVPFEPPMAKIPLVVRKIQQKDVQPLLDPKGVRIDRNGGLQRVRRKALLETGIGTCYVAVTDDDRPVYMQWLIPPADNDRVMAYFGGKFPALEQNEGLMEGAFTLEPFRGLKIMQAARSVIAMKGREFGARYLMSFADENAIAAIEGSKRAGFHPYVLRVDSWRFLRRHTEFVVLQDDRNAPAG